MTLRRRVLCYLLGHEGRVGDLGLEEGGELRRGLGTLRWEGGRKVVRPRWAAAQRGALAAGIHVGDTYLLR